MVADRLAPRELLAELPADTEIVDVAKLPRGRSAQQEQINEVIVEAALAGKRVARFKGGDNFVFGRGYEEVLACQEAGVPVTVIPGISSPLGRPGAWPASRSPTAASPTSSPSSPATCRPGHPSRSSSGARWPACAARSC